MNVRGKFNLSYLHEAKPLTLGQIRRDMSELRTGLDTIVLWQHQLDWLVKRQRRNEDERFYMDRLQPRVWNMVKEETLTPEPFSTPKLAIEGDPPRLFGVHVEVVDPE